MTGLDNNERTWILEQKKGAYRIQVDGQRAAKVIMKQPEKIALIPRTYKPSNETRISGGLLTRQISIYAPPQFLICSPSRDMPLSPISLPSPMLSYSNLLTDAAVSDKANSTPYYTFERNSSEHRVIGKDAANGKQQLTGDFKIIREERGHWGKRKLWVDGRIFNSKGNEPLIMLTMALQVLEEATPLKLEV